jgi:hypothetical protein
MTNDNSVPSPLLLFWKCVDDTFLPSIFKDVSPPLFIIFVTAAPANGESV